MRLPTISPLLWKIGGCVLVAGLIIGLANWGISWRDKAQRYNLEVGAVLGAVRLASNNPKLERADLVTQIATLGGSVAELEGGIRACKGSIDKLVQADTARQREADALLSGVLNQKAEAERARVRLEASARNPGNGQCLSPEVKNRWR